jgi:hypothetical protein
MPWRRATALATKVPLLVEATLVPRLGLSLTNVPLITQAAEVLRLPPLKREVSFLGFSTFVVSFLLVDGDFDSSVQL